MQVYKSAKNIDIERRIARKQDKQGGEFSFELEPLTSCKIISPFVKPYAEVPFILITPVVCEEHAFEVDARVTSITKKDFTVHVQNETTEVVKGVIMWRSE
jgi:hypothetical protein